MPVESSFWLRLLDYTLLSLIEGFSEFLPVSSTGHMIIYDQFLSLTQDDLRVTFMVVIQAGAIAAIAHLYFSRLLNWVRVLFRGNSHQTSSGAVIPQDRWFLIKIAAAVLPFGLVGFAFKDQIKLLFEARTVGFGLLAGGVLLIVDGYRLRTTTSFRADDVESLSWRDAFLIGLSQCAALWPGFSRSASAILGARFIGYSPKAAAEMSFLIGLPTIAATAGYELYESLDRLSLDGLGWLLFGSALAWISALISVRWFIGIVSKGGLLGFGIYRCIIGLALIIWI